MTKTTHLCRSHHNILIMTVGIALMTSQAVSVSTADGKSSQMTQPRHSLRAIREELMSTYGREPSLNVSEPGTDYWDDYYEDEYYDDNAIYYDEDGVSDSVDDDGEEELEYWTDQAEDLMTSDMTVSSSSTSLPPALSDEDNKNRTANQINNNLNMNNIGDILRGHSAGDEADDKMYEYTNEIYEEYNADYYQNEVDDTAELTTKAEKSHGPTIISDVPKPPPPCDSTPSSFVTQLVSTLESGHYYAFFLFLALLTISVCMCATLYMCWRLHLSRARTNRKVDILLDNVKAPFVVQAQSYASHRAGDFVYMPPSRGAAMQSGSDEDDDKKSLVSSDFRQPQLLQQRPIVRETGDRSRTAGCISLPASTTTTAAAAAALSSGDESRYLLL